ncbi:acetylornithine transaminase [Actinokineospora terrae]|uniref:Acetylornithine aminotransferase n=1 Tax=Actinokineospora terrae TaxID=155974 RepID=A0A1H9PZJ9_9PSEU|nr:acetylornithine transaminase [Actinokineospora terrae]SER53179.1 acetylornithine aminotransferase [Actinokineospora terrae]
MIGSNLDGQARWKSALMDNYGTPGIALVRGEGSYVWDADGNRYLDLVGGIATNVLGHAHPAVVAAVSAQIATIAHTSNLYVNPVAVELAEALLGVAGLDGSAKVVFSNSGAEANEAAFKLARLTGRPKVVATHGAFHGRTMGSLTLTGQPPKREPFQPLVPGVEHIPFGDVAALRAAVDADTAAVILEPVLGEGGVVPAPDGYLQAAREITSSAGALLILDEVQTGIGRLGSWFAFQQAGITPDVFTLAKGLGGGLPLGACIAVGAAADLFAPGHHGTTFGGNAVCAAAGLAVLRTIAADGILEHVSALGKDIAAGIEELDHPLIAGVRGNGLLLGVALTAPISGAVATAAAAKGFLVNNVQADTIRLAPPLILTEEQAGEFVAALPGILDTAADNTPVEA